MKLAARIRYATRILVELGKSPERVISLSDVEKNQKISRKYAKQILQPLEKSKIVGSRRGAGGGYFLRKPPSKIVLMDVIQSLGEDILIAPCLEKKRLCGREKDCGAKLKWMELQTMIRGFFSQTTLAEMITKEGSERRKSECKPGLKRPEVCLGKTKP